MPIFYLDSGSIDNLEISSSLLVSGSFIVSGSMNTTGGLTGSLQGTASWANNATSASFATQAANASSASFATSAASATTASYILNAASASYALSASISFTSVTSSIALNANTASYVQLAASASYALSASYAPGGGGSTILIQDEGSPQGSADTINFTGDGVTATVVGNTATVNIPGGSGQTFPYTGSAIISGSLIVTGSTDIVSGAFTVDVDSIPDLLSAGGFIGNQNNYLEVYAQNLSAGVSASTDIVAYANNGSETSSFIDMGINSSGIGAGYSFGNGNDGYVYNTGGNLYIGNNTAFFQPAVTQQSLFLFSNASGNPDLAITGSRVGIGKSGSLNNTLDINGGVTVSGSIILASGSGFQAITASETLQAGDLVNIFSGGVRQAINNDITKSVHGFVTASYLATQPVVVFYSGLITGESGLTPGTRYFLGSNAGGYTSIPPTTSGRLSQEIGIAISTTTILFQPGPAIIT